jgi:hypothetical protein
VLVGLVLLAVGGVSILWFGLRDSDGADTEVTFVLPDAVLVSDPLGLQWKFWDWYQAEIIASDPRVSGSSLTGLLGDAEFEKGIFEITNDGGMWRGMFTGIYDSATSTYYAEALLLGTGDYEGLHFRVHWAGDGIDFTGSGTIEPIAWPPTD